MVNIFLNNLFFFKVRSMKFDIRNSNRGEAELSEAKSENLIITNH